MAKSNLFKHSCVSHMHNNDFISHSSYTRVNSKRIKEFKTKVIIIINKNTEVNLN